MTDDEVRAFIGRKVDSAMNTDGNDVSTVRQENFNYYNGMPFGNERDGYSKIVSREAFEVVEWVMPSILRVFVSGDHVVVFDPMTPADEDAAAQETDIINHEVLKANRGGGFLAFHHWFKDALMNPTAYVKLYMDECEQTDVGMVTGLTADGVALLEKDDTVSILEQEAKTVQVTGPDGMPQDVEVFDLKIRTTRNVKQLCMEPVPGEEALVDVTCRSVDLDTSPFVCHRSRKTYSDLVAYGYDRDQLDKVGQTSDDGYSWGTEEVNRLFYADEDPQHNAENMDDSTREMWVHECTVLMDYDGDGIAEQRAVTMIGDEIFRNEEDNYQPLVALSAILMPHKHEGMSYVDPVKDLQLLMSTLKRQLLDNIYKINIRRKAFSEDALTEDGTTMAAMLNTQAEFIPVRGRAQDAFFPEPSQSIVGELMPVIQFFDESKNMRTGVAPNLALDPEVLQESTAAAFGQALDQSSQRIEMLVRIFAETGVKKLMLKAHQLMRQHQDVAKTIKIRGKWIPVDPQGWRDRTDMTANVGLGYNNKQQQIALITQLLAVQQQALQVGLADEKTLYNSLSKLVNASNLGEPGQYFLDPKAPGWQKPQPAPDPAMVLAQAQAQGIAAESQRKVQELQQTGQISMAELQSKHQLSLNEQQLKTKGQQLDFTKLRFEADKANAAHELASADTGATVKQKHADATLKLAQANKANAEAGHTAVEASDTFQQAKQIVEKQNADGSEGTDNSAPDLAVH
jgi:hypothetical protein